MHTIQPQRFRLFSPLRRIVTALRLKSPLCVVVDVSLPLGTSRRFSLRGFANANGMQSPPQRTKIGKLNQRSNCHQWWLTNRSQTQEGGFTLSEVLVAILLTTTFVAVAMQGMVVAMLLKSKAVQVAEANRWIQADLEQIRSQIVLNQLPIGTQRARCHPASGDLGFADLIRDNLAGGNITGIADYDLAPLVATSQTSKTFQIARTLSIPATPENTQAKILGIQYTVTPTTGGNLEQPILHFYTEVMADAALQCQ